MRFNLRLLANPYTIFAVAWCLCLVLYSIGWAGIFPTISTALFIFIFISIVVFAISGSFYNKYRPDFVLNTMPKFHFIIMMLINSTLWGVNFLYSGLPILTGLRDAEFGVPSITAISVSLNCFLSIYCFYVFLITGKKVYMLYVMYCLLFFVLVISRGNIIMSVSTMFFLWLNVKKPVITLLKLSALVIALLVISFLFGITGNVRTNKEIATYSAGAQDIYSSEVILQLGDATNSFRKSIIPGEFFWTYLYITSPVSNLQYNVNKKAPDFTLNNVSQLLINEVMLDVFSKRLNEALGTKQKKPALLIDQLTVCTTLAGSYVYAGWEGMVFLMFIYWMIPILYIALMGRKSLGVIGISTLCTMYFFSMFDNMLILQGLTFQLVYPVILVMFRKKNNGLGNRLQVA